MKKRIRWIALLVAVTLILVACGGGETTKEKYADSPHLGKWVAVEASALGMTMAADEIFDEGFSIDLKADGKCELYVDGDTATGTWEPTDKGIKFTEGSESIDAEIRDGRLKFEYEGAEIIFEKEK